MKDLFITKSEAHILYATATGFSSYPKFLAWVGEHEGVELKQGFKAGRTTDFYKTGKNVWYRKTAIEALLEQAEKQAA